MGDNSVWWIDRRKNGFLGMAVNEYNPSTGEVETGGFVEDCVVIFLESGKPSHSLSQK